MRDRMPQEIQSLIAQCEVNVRSFTNDQMSAALHLAERQFAALQLIAALADTGSDEHGDAFATGEYAPGWRVAEKMREVAVDALRGA